MASDLIPVGQVKAGQPGHRIEIGVRGADVVCAITSVRRKGELSPLAGVVLVLDGADRDSFIRLWAEAEMAAERNGSAVIRACCDHCDNSIGDAGHDYTLNGPHDGPCGQCAAERARREHDEGTC